MDASRMARTFDGRRADEQMDEIASKAAHQTIELSISLDFAVVDQLQRQPGWFVLS